MALQGYKKKQVLILDSGCSGHMTGDRSLLTSYEQKPGPYVSFGDGNKGETLGYGKMILGDVIIDQVALIAGLKHNLISISQLGDRGYHSVFDKHGCTVFDHRTGEIILRAQRHGNIYQASLESFAEGKTTCLYSKASAKESWNWHKKLSHLNFKNINYLVKHNLVRGLPQLDFQQDGLCDACQLGKQRRGSFKSKTVNTITEPFHLLHMDLFGPVNIQSISKKRYTLVIVDDFTRFTWVYFIAKKDAVSQLIFEHIAKIEKNSIFTVKFSEVIMELSSKMP
jgi:hypothetical protein